MQQRRYSHLPWVSESTTTLSNQSWPYNSLTLAANIQMAGQSKLQNGEQLGIIAVESYLTYIATCLRFQLHSPLDDPRN